MNNNRSSNDYFFLYSTIGIIPKSLNIRVNENTDKTIKMENMWINPRIKNGVVKMMENKLLGKWINESK